MWLRAKGHAYDGPQLVVDASIAVAPLDVAAIRKAIEKNDGMSKAGVRGSDAGYGGGRGWWAGVGEGSSYAAAEFAGRHDDSRGAGGYG